MVLDKNIKILLVFIVAMFQNAMDFICIFGSVSGGYHAGYHVGGVSLMYGGYHSWLVYYTRLNLINCGTGCL